MYELSCPSCRHTIRLSFVRPGAVAACAGCGRPFPVKTDYYRRVAPTAEAGVDGSDALLPAVSVAAKPAVAAAPANAGVGAGSVGNGGGAATIADNAATLTPGSAPTKASGSRPMLPPVTPPSPAGKSAPALPAIALMTSTPTPPATPGVRPAQPAARPAAAPSPASSSPAAPALPRSRSRFALLALLGLLFVLVLAVTAASIVLLRSAEPEPAPAPVPVKAPDEPVAKPPVPGPPLSSEPDIPLGRPEAIGAAKWSVANAGKKYAAPAQADKTIRVEDLRPMTADRSLVYVARLSVAGSEIYEFVTVDFTAIDKDGAILGVASVKVPMLSGRQSQAEATIPDSARPKIARVECGVTPGPQVRRPVKFDEVVVEKLSGSTAPGVKLTTYNPVDQPLRRCMFLIRGFDDRGALVGQWVVTHERQTGPAKRVDLAIVLPREATASISAWTAIGVGVVEAPAAP